MKIATWNVNGIRARQAQFCEWLERDRPDVVCLQELKAETGQIPEACKVADYHTFWHGMRAYSGVSLHRKNRFPAEPVFTHPAFDMESRIVQAEFGKLVLASVYVPNGNKDYPAKLDLPPADCVGKGAARGGTRAHPLRRHEHHAHRDGRAPQGAQARARRSAAGGARALRRAVEAGPGGCGRKLDPDNPGLFTWWAPWRNMRQRNIGWRLDYILASPGVAERVDGCVVQADARHQRSRAGRRRALFVQPDVAFLASAT